MTTENKEKKLAHGFDLPAPRPRTPVQEPVAAKFVKTERKVASSSSSRRRREIGGERLAIYLPPELVDELRVRCAKERRSISDAVTEAVSVWIRG